MTNLQDLKSKLKAKGFNVDNMTTTEMVIEANRETIIKLQYAYSGSDKLEAQALQRAQDKALQALNSPS